MFGAGSAGRNTVVSCVGLIRLSEEARVEATGRTLALITILYNSLSLVDRQRDTVAGSRPRWVG